MPAAMPAVASEDVPPFAAPYAPPDEAIAASLLAAAARPAEAEARIDARATQADRGDPRPRRRPRRGRGFPPCLFALHQGGPGADGAGRGAAARARCRHRRRLIEDKLAAGDWSTHRGEIRRACWSRPRPGRSGITARIIQPGETPETIVEQLVKRLGLPAVRAATRQAMRLLGSHFVLGQTIDEALARAGRERASPAIPSTCWARAPAPPPTPTRYFDSYADAIDAIGASAGKCAPCRARPGISVKLSALHPRYEPLSRERVLKELGAAACSSWRGMAQVARTQFHRRRRGGRPAGTVARRDRRGAAPTRRCAAGTVSASRCRPIRSAPPR